MVVVHIETYKFMRLIQRGLKASALILLFRSQLSLSQEENEKKSRFSLAFVRAAGRYNNKAIKRWLKKQCREITIRQCVRRSSDRSS